MERIKLELPQLKLIGYLGSRNKYLERLAFESNEPKAELIFQEDSQKDSRIIAIKYNVNLEKPENHILYYSEAFNDHNNYAIITGNLGYGYMGRVLVIDKKGHKMGVNFEHLPKDELRLKHLERIDERMNERDDIIGYLRTEYVAERYKDFIYNLKKYS